LIPSKLNFFRAAPVLCVKPRDRAYLAGGPGLLGPGPGVIQLANLTVETNAGRGVDDPGP
jgi:hypothetical protein